MHVGSIPFTWYLFTSDHIPWYTIMNVVITSMMPTETSVMGKVDFSTTETYSVPADKVTKFRKKAYSSMLRSHNLYTPPNKPRYSKQADYHYDYYQ